ncbi:hypothetical protein G9A89_003483 [Geosiphon pyriformis]|nr:hypothetical protein G9A89_003483 [Geosiphon pyriformis]
MFGCIVAGRLIQTNLQQIDTNKFVFELPDALTINHIVVFLLGTVPFEPGYAATVHFLWPGGEDGWKLLGMLSNEKPSAIFRLRGAIIPSGTSSTSSITSKLLTEGTSMDLNEDAFVPSQITATLGISIEPITVVETAISAITAQISYPPGGPDNLSQVAINILKNLYNYVTSFATTSLPLGFQNSHQSYIPLKVFQDWYDGFVRKVKINPALVLKGDRENGE